MQPDTNHQVMDSSKLVKATRIGLDNSRMAHFESSSHN